MNSLSAHQVNLAASTSHVGSWLVAALFVIVLLAYVALVIGALISVVASGVSGGMKVVWIVFVLVAPVIGSLAWFVVGRRDSSRKRAIA
jgi:Phospholipase_D-nuclease N-terminal